MPEIAFAPGTAASMADAGAEWVGRGGVRGAHMADGLDRHVGKFSSGAAFHSPFQGPLGSTEPAPKDQR